MRDSAHGVGKARGSALEFPDSFVMGHWLESCWARSYSMEEAMVSLHPEYVVDDKGKRKAVVLPVEEWEKVIDELEELEDIRLYDAAKQETGEAVPFDQVVEEIEQDTGR